VYRDIQDGVSGRGGMAYADRARATRPYGIGIRWARNIRVICVKMSHDLRCTDPGKDGEIDLWGKVP